MSTARPLIGVSASFFHPDPARALFKGKTLLYAEQSLLHWVMSAGAVPVLMPTVGGSLFAADMVAQIDGLVKDVMDIDPVEDKWRAFNWHVLTIDGHDPAAILDALDRVQRGETRPPGADLLATSRRSAS